MHWPILPHTGFETRNELSFAQVGMTGGFSKHFTLHNITWRALPAECGNWNSIWKRFWRLSQAGVFEAFFDALAAMSQTAHLVQRFDSTVVRAHVSAAGAKGGQDGQALGRSRGGFSTKIHLKADLGGRPLAFHLTEGQDGDSPQFEILLDLGLLDLGLLDRGLLDLGLLDLGLLDLGPDITPRAAVGDKGYDAKANRAAARERSICPVIPVKSSAKTRPTFHRPRLGRHSFRRRSIGLVPASSSLWVSSSASSGWRSAARRRPRTTAPLWPLLSASSSSNPSTRLKPRPV